MQDIVSKLLHAAIWSSNLGRLPFLGQAGNLDLLVCTGFNSEHTVCSHALFNTQRPTNGQKIEQSDTQRPVYDQSIEQSDEYCFGQPGDILMLMP